MTKRSEMPGCLLAIVKLIQGGGPAGGEREESLPYRRADYLLTRAERSFFGVLQQAVGGRYLIFAKVRLADVLYLPRGTESRQKHFNRIQSKHLDFVLCEPDAVRPVLAVELDDSSHRRTSRRERDDFLERALAAAGLPLLRVDVRRAYQPADVAREIETMLNPPPPSPPST